METEAGYARTQVDAVLTRPCLRCRNQQVRLISQANDNSLPRRFETRWWCRCGFWGEAPVMGEREIETYRQQLFNLVNGQDAPYEVPKSGVLGSVTVLSELDRIVILDRRVAHLEDRLERRTRSLYAALAQVTGILTDMGVSHAHIGAVSKILVEGNDGD